MNCTELFLSQAKAKPKAMAIWHPRTGATSFAELKEMAEKAQSVLRELGLKPGDSVLLVDSLGPRLYALVIAVLALGGTVVLVEPWMPVPKIERVIDLVKPRLFLTNWLGRVWATRISAARKIPHWVSTARVRSATRKGGLQLESVPGETPGIITFTSGTTGNPKGVVRHQSYLVHQYEVLSHSLGLGELAGPDLCIFANFAMANMAAGRGSLIVPPAWKAKVLRAIDSLPKELAPDSLTAGPAFLLELMAHARVPSLKSIHVGGALTDCWIFEKGFAHWKDTHWMHLYGSSEAEPVATAEAHGAVARSKARGYFQTLSLGRTVDAIRSNIEADGAWVTGPHVCPRYVGNEEENTLYKKKDSEGNVWHFMGDRIAQDGEGWWYAGRSQQKVEDFALEQKIYTYLGASHSFVHRDKQGKLHLIGKKLKVRAVEIRGQFPALDSVVETAIHRDPRHRARIDRKKSLQKGASWLAG